MSREPIAVLGIGCRFPQADGPAQFWRMLYEEVDAITEVPPDRWNVDELWSEDASRPGHTYARWGGFVERGDWFDAGVFGIGSAEAERMDPQQGMVLECAWQALEYAGIAPDSLRDSSTGVFVGLSNCDFDRKLCSDLRNLDLRAGTGTSYSIVANRLSYALGLCGPSIAVDLACSASLSAVHLACQSLWLAECGLALAGGVHLILSPEKTVTFSRGKVLARDGRCKSFSSEADGYVRGEGCGMLVLKRLADAQRDGDRIVAVIRGSALNHNGPSNGLSAPMGRAQRRLIERALATSGVLPRELGYVEAHSPGSTLGDIIEINALKAALGEGRAAGERYVVGSVKPNIGHLEGAAGVASLIKALLIVREGWIPKTLHTHPHNPALQLESSALRIACRSQIWPGPANPRRAAVTSLSFGGANACVVVEEAPALPWSAPASGPKLLALSAATGAALVMLAERYARYCTELGTGANACERFANTCFTAGVGRKHFACRLAVVAHDPREAAQALNDFVRNSTRDDPGAAPIAPRGKRTMAFVFAGGDAFAESMSLLVQLNRCGIHADFIYGTDAAGERVAEAARARHAALRTAHCAPPGDLSRTAIFGFGAVPQAMREASASAVALIEPGGLMRAAAAAYLAGVVPQWGALFPGHSRETGLPLYPFERQCHWRHFEYPIERTVAPVRAAADWSDREPVQ